jgi:hypothetical protein
MSEEASNPEDDSLSGLESEWEISSPVPFDTLFDDLQGAPDTADSGVQQQPFSRLCRRCQGIISVVSQELIDRRLNSEMKMIDREFFLKILMLCENQPQ